MAREHHVTILVEDAIIRLSGYIIEELEKDSIGIFGGKRLLLADLVNTDKDFVINRSSLV